MKQSLQFTLVSLSRVNFLRPPRPVGCWMLLLYQLLMADRTMDESCAAMFKINFSTFHFSRFTSKLSSLQWVLLEFTDSLITKVQVLPCVQNHGQGRLSRFCGTFQQFQDSNSLHRCPVLVNPSQLISIDLY